MTKTKTLKKYRIRYEPSFLEEQEWLIYHLRKTDNPTEHRIIKNLLDLIGK